MHSDKFHTDGNLIAIDLWGVDFEILNQPSFLCHEARLAAEKAGMQVLAISIVPFRPQGFSIACILGESHLTIHTSPEHGYAAIDVFTCGKGNPLMAAEYLIGMLKPKEICVKELQRGVKPKSIKDKFQMGFQLKGVELASR
ncbi:MAG: adenosylmethionine decarboxylase [Deltaproteobacteria bacterium]|nr:adenosylmethionine decarboxylase [Deltaproteobacteria bacterium]